MADEARVASHRGGGAEGVGCPRVSLTRNEAKPGKKADWSKSQRRDSRHLIALAATRHCVESPIGKRLTCSRQRQQDQRSGTHLGRRLALKVVTRFKVRGGTGRPNAVPAIAQGKIFRPEKAAVPPGKGLAKGD